MSGLAGQELAYERAVEGARRDPALRAVVEETFLHEDPAAALSAFRASEHWARVLRLLERCGVAPGARVLDFGGGRGLVAAALSLAGYRAVLCEINPSEVCGAGAAVAVRSATGADFEIAGGPVSELRAGAPFDAVVCRSVLHHVEPLGAVLSDLREVIRPAGWLIASDEPTIRSERELERLRGAHPFVAFGVEETAYRVGDYRAALEAAGFERVEDRFPVAFGDYRRILRASDPAPVAALLYARYRLRSALRPAPGQSRSFVARAP